MEHCDELERPPRTSVSVGSATLKRGSRVRLRPRAGADVLDQALAGRTAIVEGIDEDDAGGVHVAVTLADDPGRDLGEARFHGHRFYFRIDELEPLEAGSDPAAAPRILVAGIGNIFFGDDAFGVEVVQRIGGRSLGAGVDVVDFGIRGMDLVHALQRGYDGVILVDATQRGGAPGTLYVIEPELGAEDRASAGMTCHGIDPLRALRMARAFGAQLGRLRIVGCEPGRVPDLDEELDAAAMDLSEPVRAAAERAVDLIASVIDELEDELARGAA